MRLVYCSSLPCNSCHLLVQKMHRTVDIALIAIIGISSAFLSDNVKTPTTSYSDDGFLQFNAPFQYCITCLNTIDGYVNALLYSINKKIVTSSCDMLCQAVADKSKSQETGAFCNLVCQAIGIDEFITTVEHADLDVIRYCQITEICPGNIVDCYGLDSINISRFEIVNDNGDAKITDLSISPVAGRQGTTFYTDFYYTSDNGTGTGEALIEVLTPDGIPVSVARLIEGRNAGKYFETISFTTEPDPQCDTKARK
jgi:hypothetical protein